MSTSELSIGVVLSTTRETRFADKAAAWLMARLQKQPGMRFDLLDLRKFPMPMFDEVASNAWAPSKDPTAQAWQKEVGRRDGFVFLTAEYNRSIPGVLKNALDYAYPEWNHKPAAYVGYGSVGAARAIEHLRLICVELQMAPMRSGVHIQGGDFFATWQHNKPLEELTYLDKNIQEMAQQLRWWGEALRAARAAKT